MIIRKLLRYLLEYDSNEKVFIEMPSGTISPDIRCCVQREGPYEGLIIRGEEIYETNDRQYELF